jgi:hypothetical protein
MRSQGSVGDAKPRKRGRRGVSGCEQSNRGTKPGGGGGILGADSDLAGLRGTTRRGPPRTIFLLRP